MPWVLFISGQREHLTFPFAHPPLPRKSTTAKAKISLSLLLGVQKNRQLIFTNTYVYVSSECTSTPSYSCSSTTQYCGSPSWLSHLEIDWCFMVTRAMSHRGYECRGTSSCSCTLSAEPEIWKKNLGWSGLRWLVEWTSQTSNWRRMSKFRTHCCVMSYVGISVVCNEWVWMLRETTCHGWCMFALFQGASGDLRVKTESRNYRQRAVGSTKNMQSFMPRKTSFTGLDFSPTAPDRQTVP